MTNPRTCWFPVAELGRDILGIRSVPIKLAIEHPIASLGKGGRASAPKVDELVSGDFALDNTPPCRGASERFGLIDAVPPYLGPVLVGPAELNPLRYRSNTGTFRCHRGCHSVPKCTLAKCFLSILLMFMERVKGIEPSS